MVRVFLAFAKSKRFEQVKVDMVKATEYEEENLFYGRKKNKRGESGRGRAR